MAVVVEDLSKEFHPVPKPGKPKKKAKPIKKNGKKAKQWLKERVTLVKEAIAAGRFELKNNIPFGRCDDCGHYHYLSPDHRIKRSQGGSHSSENIDWICNTPPCSCHDKRDNLGDPNNKKKRAI